MDRPTGLCVLAAWIVVSALGCAARMDPASIFDAQLAARVRSALVNDPVVGVFPIEVRVNRGVARLSGRVPAEDDIARALEIARGVPGITRVVSELEVAGEIPVRPPPVQLAGEFIEDNASGPGSRRILAVGGVMGWNGPETSLLDAGASLGPLVRLGSGQGLGVTIGFGWYGTDLLADADEGEEIGRVRIRPLMGGLGYTLRNDRLSMSLSAVAGVAFNGVSLRDELSGRVVPIAVGNSLAWRPAASFWLDASDRVAVNVSVGYVMTRPWLTFIESGEIVRRRLTADTLQVRAGVAYKIF